MKGSPLSYRLNAYFAALAITIVGSGAALFIIHIANASDSFAMQNAASYQSVEGW